MQQGLLPMISSTTVRRWLSELAIKPWHYRSWISVRDPEFETKAGRILDLYAGVWDGEPLGPDDMVICADEKTSIQARGRSEPVRPPGSGHVSHMEYDYQRGGAVTYLAALDVFQGTVLGRVVGKTGIMPFRDLVRQVMRRKRYRHARRVFWIVDNGSSHQPGTFGTWLTQHYPNAMAVHLPVHASWLNQIESYFSIVQRKALTPNDLPTIAAVALRILDFEQDYNRTAQPFKWRFTRDDLRRRLKGAA